MKAHAENTLSLIATYKHVLIFTSFSKDYGNHLVEASRVIDTSELPLSLKGTDLCLLVPQLLSGVFGGRGVGSWMEFRSITTSQFLEHPSTQSVSTGTQM